MNVLFLGPACPQIEKALSEYCSKIFRTEAPLDLDMIHNGMFDFGISYRYRYIIKPDIIDFFDGNIINLHISYLPWNKGSDPNLWSWLDDTPKGVTIHQVAPKLDAGAILLQEAVPLDPDSETLKTSYLKLSLAIENLFSRHVGDILTGKLGFITQMGGGSYHRSADKNIYLPLIERQGWDTPVRQLMPESRKKINCE